MADEVQASQNSQVEGSAYAQEKDSIAQSEAVLDTRQKRKRTSPHDQSVLEAAYQKNSKPDKEDRLRLVQQVDLREKEVQIWFQNRRQNDRRKSKPLQPHELIPHFRNAVPIEASSQQLTPDDSQNTQPESSNEGPPSQQDTQMTLSSQNDGADNAPNNSASPIATHVNAEVQQTPNSGKGVLATPPSTLERTEPNAAINRGAAGISYNDVAQISKKRSREQMNEGHSDDTIDENSPKDSKALRRSSSFVRLAVSADGSVKVRVNDEVTPSPEKERPTAPPSTSNKRSSGLTRAQSDLNFRDVSRPARGALGRSRDARTWEFYCDRSSRASLAIRAEEEATGSAVGALELMRSATPRRPHPLTPNHSKHNNLRRSQSSLKSKPGLERTHSSMARLQSSSSVVGDSPSFIKPSLHRRSSGSDSDKENWQPGTRQHTNGQSRTQGAHSQPQTDSSRSKQYTSGSQETRTRPVNGKAKVEDLDCVQGLLSLSQGAWR